MTTEPIRGVIQHLRKVLLLGEASGMTDGQLLESYLTQREEAAFEALVRRHGPMVLGVCRRVLGDAHDADDAFQATFLVLVRKAATIVPRELVGHWLYGVAYRTALKAKTLTARRRAKERQAQAIPRPAAQAAEVWPDWQPMLDAELNRLPAKYQVPLVLCALKGQSKREVARQLGLPEGTVSSRLVRARALLRKRLTARGVTLTAGALAMALSPQATTAAVPAVLVDATVKGAVLFAAGSAAAGAVSAQTAALTKGVLQAMLLTKLRLATVFVLALGVLTLGVGTLTYSAWPHREAAVAANVLPPPTLEPPEQAQPVPPPEQKKEPPAKPPPPPKPGDKRVKAEEVLTKTFTTKGSPRVVVGTFNGGLRVTTGAPGTVAAKVTKQTTAGTQEAAQEELKNIEVTMQQEGETVTITAKAKEPKPQVSRGASAEVQVPPGAVLALQTSNGGVVVTGATGDVTAHSSNGGIAVKGGKGKLHLTTSNGGIQVEGGSGPLDLKTSNGPVEIRTGAAVVAAHTSNGSIRFTGRLAKGDHSFETSNGNITLTLPADAQ